MHRLDTILATPVPHKELVSVILPCNMDPWPARYHSLADSMKPIEPIETSHHPGQTYDPIVSNVRYVPIPPMTSMDGGKPSTPIALEPFNARGKPPKRSMLPTSGVVTNNRHTSTTGPSSLYVLPTNTNIVNPPLSSSQALRAQPVVNQASWGYVL